MLGWRGFLVQGVGLRAQSRQSLEFGDQDSGIRIRGSAFIC